MLTAFLLARSPGSSSAPRHQLELAETPSKAEDTRHHNDIVCAIDRSEITGLVLLDLSSAFDTVDHTSLLSVIESRFSVTGQSLAWFRSYLTDRAQVFRPLLLGPVRLSQYH